MVGVCCGTSPLLPGDLLSPQLGFVHLGEAFKRSVSVSHQKIGALTKIKLVLFAVHFSHCQAGRSLG